MAMTRIDGKHALCRDVVSWSVVWHVTRPLFTFTCDTKKIEQHVEVNRC